MARQVWPSFHIARIWILGTTQSGGISSISASTCGVLLDKTLADNPVVIPAPCYYDSTLLGCHIVPCLWCVPLPRPIEEMVSALEALDKLQLASQTCIQRTPLENNYVPIR
jgi:hypothetical protein